MALPNDQFYPYVHPNGITIKMHWYRKCVTNKYITPNDHPNGVEFGWPFGVNSFAMKVHRHFVRESARTCLS